MKMMYLLWRVSLLKLKISGLPEWPKMLLFSQKKKPKGAGRVILLKIKLKNRKFRVNSHVNQEKIKILSLILKVRWVALQK